MEKILVIGSNGQLGSVLVEKLRTKHGTEHVIASDIIDKELFLVNFKLLDATDFEALSSIVKQNQITQIYHMAAVLSATGEQNPLLAWDINMKTLINVLEVARLYNVKKVFYPSSIAVFGDSVEKNNAPQNTFLDPKTVYGVSKVSGEVWCNYYFHKYGVDVRSLRYPGVISYQSLPGGGTTDYAVDIFHKAVLGESYNCYLNSDTVLPMIYIDDAIRATIELMEAPVETINTRTSYNVSGVSFSPKELVNSIRKRIEDFKVIYTPDYRQTIAKSWPGSIDDTEAKNDWNWAPEFDLESIANDMISKLKEYYKTLA